MLREVDPAIDPNHIAHLPSKPEEEEKAEPAKDLDSEDVPW